jgi:hypothetical protein
MSHCGVGSGRKGKVKGAGKAHSTIKEIYIHIKGRREEEDKYGQCALFT